MMVQNPPLRRPKRPAQHLLVHAGVFVCGLAGGLVELLALQRSRLQQRRHRMHAARQR
jgi:hypothetical protein